MYFSATSAKICRSTSLLAVNDSEFDAVIIDEACQASEPESLIPFKYNPTTICIDTLWLLFKQQAVRTLLV